MRKILPILFLFVLLISCSKMTDKEYMDQAKNLLKEQKVSDAIENYKKLIDEFPNSKLSITALQELANIYQNNLDKSVSQSESFDLSQKYFREVFDKYPNSVDAPKSLFMSGFILANELKRYDDATETYKLFLEKFPKNPLAVSAQQELDNMGLAPEDILKKKTVVKN